MSSQQPMTLDKEKEDTIQKIVALLLSFGKKSHANLSAVEHAKHVFEILHRISAGCIAEAAISYDNIDQLSDEIAKSTKQLALIMYGEKGKYQQAPSSGQRPQLSLHERNQQGKKG